MRLRMRRLVVLSALLISVGLLLLLPSSTLWQLLTTGSATSSAQAAFGAPSSAGSDTATIESLLGFGLIGVGLVLEILSLFTEVGTGVLPANNAEGKRP